MQLSPDSLSTISCHDTLVFSHIKVHNILQEHVQRRGIKLKKTILSKIFILQMGLICVISFNACGNINTNIGAEAIQIPTPLALPEELKQEKFKEIESENTQQKKENIKSVNSEPEVLPSEQAKKQVYICPDMPQPYVEVLKQYEQFINADIQDINDDSVLEKLGGEWKYLYDELYLYMSSSYMNCSYALADLTGDGYPEMIMGYGNIPDVIYTYSETSGIGMEFASSYYDMTIYQTGIIEYISGGMNYSTTYLQYQEDLEKWTVVDSLMLMNGTEYYSGSWTSDGVLDTEITEEEYLQIQEKYASEPMEFEWIPLVTH